MIYFLLPRISDPQESTQMAAHGIVFRAFRYFAEAIACLCFSINVVFNNENLSIWYLHALV